MGFTSFNPSYGLFQVREQQCFDVSGHSEASDNERPKFERRCYDQISRQSQNVQVVVEVIAATAVLRLAKGTRVTFPIMADAAEVTCGLVGEENVGTEVDVLSGALEAAASKRQLVKINCVIDSDKNISVAGDRFCCGQRSHER